MLLAARTNNRELFKLIYTRPPDQLNAVDHSGQTILHKLVLFPDPNKLVKFLLKKYININTIDAYGIA